MRDYPTREIFEDDFPNVKGTAIGPNDELIVYVTAKRPESELDTDDIVPAEVVIDGRAYITDVEPIAIPYGQDVPMAQTEPADHQDRHRPIPGGVSIGNIAVGAGTVGHPRLEHVESGDIVGLSNSHVSGNSTEQYQPAKMDGGAEQEAFGTLREASDLDPSQTQTTDSALIDIFEPDQVSNEILGIGELAGFGDVEPTYEYTYKKGGRTTGVTSGDLRGRDASIRVAYGPDTVRVSGCAVFSRMSAPGDSGSLIGVEMPESGFHATHLLFAGSSQATIAIPLDAVQEEHGELTVVGEDSGGDSDPVTWGEFRYQARTATSPPAGSVVDGDTYDLDLDLGFHIHKTDQRIRLLGIDTAERGTEDYDRHTQFAEEWFEKAAAEYDGDDEWPLIVDTHKDETGSFGRWLVYIQRKSDGERIGDALTDEFGEDVRYEITEQLERLLR